MKEQKKSLSALLAPLKKYPQKLTNIPLNCRLKETVLQSIQTLAEEATNSLQSAGRVLIRASGTEPLLRVMVEGQDQSLVNDWSARLKAQVIALMKKSETSSVDD